LHLACQALQAGECDGAVIGASNLFLSPDYALSLTRLGAIAADGQCKTFDAAANGYGRGEGTNAVYIKRLSDAIRDGDSIRAIIRGTSSNRYVPHSFINDLMLTDIALALHRLSLSLLAAPRETQSCKHMPKLELRILARQDTSSAMALVRLLVIV